VCARHNLSVCKEGVQQQGGFPETCVWKGGSAAAQQRFRLLLLLLLLLQRRPPAAGRARLLQRVHGKEQAAAGSAHLCCCCSFCSGVCLLPGERCLCKRALPLLLLLRSHCALVCGKVLTPALRVRGSVRESVRVSCTAPGRQRVLAQEAPQAATPPLPLPLPLPPHILGPLLGAPSQ